MLRKLRILAFIVLAVGVVFRPYLDAVIFKMNGTRQTTGTSRSGQAYPLMIGPEAPIPAWLPLPEAGFVVARSALIKPAGQPAEGFALFLTRTPPERLRQQYRADLKGAGFVVTTMIPTLAQQRAGAVFSLIGSRPADGVGVTVTAGTTESMVLEFWQVRIDWGS